MAWLTIEILRSRKHVYQPEINTGIGCNIDVECLKKRVMLSVVPTQLKYFQPMLFGDITAEA